MTQYLIYATEQEAKDRSHEAYEADTMAKRGGTRTGLPPAEYVTQYQWGWDVGADGQTALVISEAEHLLTPEEQAALIDDLPDDVEGDNWYKPPPEMPLEDV